MKQFALGMCLYPIILVFATPSIASEPVRVTVPSHPVWCVKSQPIEIEQDKELRFGDIIFQSMYQRLERNALAAGLPSIGIPYLESSTAGGVPPADTLQKKGDATTVVPVTGAVPIPVPVKYILHVCSAVPFGISNKLPPGVFELMLSETTVYALLCAVQNESGCKLDIEAYVKKTHNLTDDNLRNLEWRTNQPKTKDESGAAIANALSDYSLRPLSSDSDVVGELPLDFMIISVPVPK